MKYHIGYRQAQRQAIIAQLTDTAATSVTVLLMFATLVLVIGLINHI